MNAIVFLILQPGLVELFFYCGDMRRKKQLNKISNITRI